MAGLFSRQTNWAAMSNDELIETLQSKKVQNAASAKKKADKADKTIKAARKGTSIFSKIAALVEKQSKP